MIGVIVGREAKVQFIALMILVIDGAKGLVLFVCALNEPFKTEFCFKFPMFCIV